MTKNSFFWGVCQIRCFPLYKYWSRVWSGGPLRKSCSQSRSCTVM